MKLATLCTSLAIVAACSKTEPPKVEAKAAAEPTAVESADWAKDRPASISAESIAAVDSLLATYNAQKPALTSGDCLRIADAFIALTPGTKRISDEAGKVDAVAATDPVARKWLDASFNPRVGIVLTGLKAAMQTGDCKALTVWKEAVLGWVRATGFVPPNQ